MFRRRYLPIIFIISNLIIKCSATHYNPEENEEQNSDKLSGHNNESAEITDIPCEIPNEDKLGICLEVSQCSAYLQVRNSTNLPAEKVNFLKKVQCVSNVSYDERARSLEPLVCCTTNGQDYRFPSIQFSKFEYRRFQDATARFKKKKLKRRIQTVEPIEGFNLLNECGKQVTHRIYGGEIAELDEFPWLALLVYNTSKLCVSAEINYEFERCEEIFL